MNGNENGRYIRDRNSCTISELTESFIKGTVTLDDALNIIQNNKVVYASDATMQAGNAKKNQQPIKGQRDRHKSAAGTKTPIRTKQGAHRLCL